MTTLQISKEKAKELYPTASTEFKTMLEETFGKDFFIVSIMDRVKTFEDAWMIRNGYTLPANWFRAYDRDVRAFIQLQIITEVLNEGKEGEYFPIFDKHIIIQSGCGSQYSTYYPHKLLLATKELSDYAGTRFIELYKDYLL